MEYEASGKPKQNLAWCFIVEISFSLDGDDEPLTRLDVTPGPVFFCTIYKIIISLRCKTDTMCICRLLVSHGHVVSYKMLPGIIAV